MKHERWKRNLTIIAVVIVGLLITGAFIGKRFVKNRKKGKRLLEAKDEERKDQKAALEAFKKGKKGYV